MLAERWTAAVVGEMKTGNKWIKDNLTIYSGLLPSNFWLLNVLSDWQFPSSADRWLQKSWPQVPNGVLPICYFSEARWRKVALSQVIRHLLAYKTCLYSLDQKLKKMESFWPLTPKATQDMRLKQQKCHFSCNNRYTDCCWLFELCHHCRKYLKMEYTQRECCSNF